MTQKDTKQKPTINFVLDEKTALDGGKGFGGLTGPRAFSRTPDAGKALSAYAAAGRKHIAKQIIYAEKTKAATVLMSQAYSRSVADLSYTAQINLAIARAIPDEELAAFVEDYVRNGLNYLSVTHAKFLELLSDELIEIIKEDVEPSLFERLFG